MIGRRIDKRPFLVRPTVRLSLKGRKQLSEDFVLISLKANEASTHRLMLVPWGTG